MYKFGKLSGAQLRKQKLIKLANQYNLSIYSEGTKNRNKMLSADGIYNKLKKFFRDNYNYKLNFDNIDSIDNESPYFEGLPTARLQNLARLSNMYKISLAIGPQGPKGLQGQRLVPTKDYVRKNCNFGRKDARYSQRVINKFGERLVDKYSYELISLLNDDMFYRQLQSQVAPTSTPVAAYNELYYDDTKKNPMDVSPDKLFDDDVAESPDVFGRNYPAFAFYDKKNGTRAKTGRRFISNKNIFNKSIRIPVLKTDLQAIGLNPNDFKQLNNNQEYVAVNLIEYYYIVRRRKTQPDLVRTIYNRIKGTSPPLNLASALTYVPPRGVVESAVRKVPQGRPSLPTIQDEDLIAFLTKETEKQFRPGPFRGGKLSQRARSRSLPYKPPEETKAAAEAAAKAAKEAKAAETRKTNKLKTAAKAAKEAEAAVAKTAAQIGAREIRALERAQRERERTRSAFGKTRKRLLKR